MLQEFTCFNAEALHDFFGALKRCRPTTLAVEQKGNLESVLREFVERLGPILQTDRSTARTQKKQTAIINPQYLQETFRKLEEPLAIAKRAGLFCDPWEVASLRRDEVRNAKVLAWLLDQRGSHGMGAIILNEILASLKPLGFCQSSLQNPRNINIWVESCPDGIGNNRVDIEIEGKLFYIIFEVKIDAPEGPDQINRYCRVAKDKSNHRPWFVIYLTPDGRASGCLDQEFRSNVLRLSWRTVGLSIARAIRNVREDISPFSYFLAEKFAFHIRKF